MVEPSRKRGSNGRADIVTGHRFVLIAFALVAGGVLSVTSFALGQTRALDERARNIVEDLLASVRLAGEIERQVGAQRALVDEHILATGPVEMASLEGRLLATNALIDGSMTAYDSWANDRGEREAWERTRAGLLALRDPVSRALSLSRENRDSEAKQVMQLANEDFTQADRNLDRLIAINDHAAIANLAEFSGIRFRLMLALIGIGVSALAGTVVVGRWSARQIARREEQLSLKAEELEQRNRELDAFAGRVAHDIRGRLTAIKLATGQLASRVPEERRTTETLKRGTRRMEALVDDLLTLARIGAQTGGRCDPAVVVAELQEDFASRLQGEMGALRVAVDHAQVPCSAGLLRQALTNLTENAFKYRRPDLTPEVEISGGIRDDGYSLRITDNGLGMAPEDVDRVFEPFYRSPRTQDVPGTGLGLAIVNRVVQASGGTVSLQTSLGQGSTFTVQLPLTDGHGQGEGGREA